MQDHFDTASGNLLEMLHAKIQRCDAVIALVGWWYGAEPRLIVDGKRRSYTQLEVEIAQQLGKPVVLLFAAEACPPDNSRDQSEELLQLQTAHRQRLQATDQIWYTFATLEELKERIAALPFLKAETVGGRPCWLPFPSLRTLFKGREKFLEQVRQTLTQNPRLVAVTARYAIHGLGGVGKTRLAVEYAWRFAEEYNALLFVTADTPANFSRNLAELCGPLVLNLPEHDAREEPIRVAAVFRWLRDHPGWLLIVDNVDTPEAAASVRQRISLLNTGHLLITSRLADWNVGVETLALDVLDEDSAASFLLERTTGKRLAQPSDAEDAKLLAGDLGGLALALEQAGAFVVKHRTSFADYRLRWHQQERKVIEWYDRLTMQYPRSLATTWEMTVDRLSFAAGAFFHHLAWMAPEPIPADLFRQFSLSKKHTFPSAKSWWKFWGVVGLGAGVGLVCGSALGHRVFTSTSSFFSTLGLSLGIWLGSQVAIRLRYATDEETVSIETILGELSQYSLISWDEGAGMFQVHRLVQEMIRYKSPKTLRGSFLEHGIC